MSWRLAAGVVGVVALGAVAGDHRASAQDAPAAAQDQAEAAPADAPEPAPPPRPFLGVELEKLNATRTAPLFTPSRTRPPEDDPEPEVEPVEEPGPEPEAGPPSLRLIGIVMAQSEQVALLADPGGTIHRSSPGEDFDGWVLSIKDSRTVELKKGDESKSLTMFEPGAAPPPNPLDNMSSEDDENEGSEDDDSEDSDEEPM